MHIETQAIMTRVMTGKAPHDVVYGIINYFRKHVSVTCSISSYRYTASIKGFHEVSSPETVEALTDHGGTDCSRRERRTKRAGRWDEQNHTAEGKSPIVPCVCGMGRILEDPIGVSIVIRESAVR